MTQEDVKLLANDLCGRFPYNIYARLNDQDVRVIDISYSRNNVYFTLVGPEKTYVGVDVDRIRPYLRSISTMTDEERQEYLSTFDSFGNEQGVKLVFPMEKSFAWLNEHHFDFRGLIEKGLAIEAPDWMYK